MSTETAHEQGTDASIAPFEPVLRPRVIERLRLAARRRITLVVAPAGFGKSVAIRQYLETDGIEHLRFSVRKEHDSLVGFLRGLVVALEPIAPKASKSVAGAYEKASRGNSPVRDLAAWVAALLARYEGTVVVDDLHSATGDQRVLELIAEVIALSPESTKWILTTRSHLSLPYASWLAYGAMEELIDEEVLALTEAEALTAATSAVATVDKGRIAALLAETKGWPAAYMFSLRDIRRADPLVVGATLAREVLYNYLAYQVLSDLSETERTFMIETSVLGSLDARLLEAGGLVGAESILTNLRRRAAFISLESQGVYRYHELFREFLEHELRSLGIREHHRVIHKIAEICQRSGQLTMALSLYAQISDEVSITGILSSAGTDLFTAGHLEIIDKAMKAISLEKARTEILLLCARLKAAYGLDKEADLFYRRAGLLAATFDDRALVAWRYASHLARRQQLTQALAIVADIPLEKVQGVGLRSLLCGTKASILSCIGDISEALTLVEEALVLVRGIDDEATTNAVLSYGGFVNLKAQRLLAAREMATLCLEGAIRAANYELAVVACTQLNNIALDQNDGDLADLALDTMLSSSSRGGDLRMRGIALMNMYDRAGMRGDESELERLANPVSTYRETDPKTWSECVAPTLAMQSAWAGDFSSAVSVLIEAAAVEFDDSQRVLRLAEIALYASVGKEPRDLSDARAYLQEANDIMAVNEQLAGARIRRARLMMSIARGLLFDEPSGLALAKWLLTLTSTDEADLRLDGSNDARSKQLSDFDEFKSKEFLGWRRALSSAINARLRPAENPLTKTEQQIATLIASGHTSREVADILNRSVLTIETHVRSILRKLGSTNRRVAMRRARELGYI